MRKRLSVKSNRLYTLVIIGVLVFVLIMHIIFDFSSERLAIQGSDDRHGVYFTYEGIEYQVWIVKSLGEGYDISDMAMLIPDDNYYDIIENKSLVVEYDLWTGYCDCYKRKEDMNVEVTVTMNISGNPEEYTFNLFKYDERDVKKIVYILDEKGVHGYGVAIENLTEDKEN